jgi:RND family efflux transporter MFP subunit
VSKKRWIFVAAAAAIAACGQALAQESDLDCVIEASEIAEVSSSVRGIMSVVEVERGDWVRKGQVVARLEASVEQATVTLAKARAESMTSIRAGEARVALAEKQVQRIRNLREAQSISSQALDEAETDLIVSTIALEQAVEEKEIAALDLERAKRVLELRTIRSPVSGVVARVYTSASESVEDRPIMQIAQIDPLYVEAIAPVERFGSIEQGMASLVYPEQPIGGEFEATVSLVERIIDASSGTFGVRLVLPNPDGKLPAGLRCKVRFSESDGPTPAP